MEEEEEEEEEEEDDEGNEEIKNKSKLVFTIFLCNSVNLKPKVVNKQQN